MEFVRERGGPGKGNQSQDEDDSAALWSLFEGEEVQEETATRSAPRVTLSTHGDDVEDVDKRSAALLFQDLL